MATLDAAGLRDNTIIVFTSDHGDFVGSYGLYQKQGPWDTSANVPFLVSGPGITAGASPLCLSAIDILPTICGLCQVPPAETFQGRDLSKHIHNQTVPDNDQALLASYHLFGAWQKYSSEPQVASLHKARIYRGLRTAQYTYCIDHNGPWLLYDNQADPWQQNNLINTPELSDIQNNLHSRLMQQLADYGDDMPTSEVILARWNYITDDQGYPVTSN